MKIYNRSGQVVLDVQVEDNSFRHRVIMGDHNLTLHYSLAEHVELPVGSYCTFEGQTYTLKRPENLKMKHSRNFEYTVLLESPQADAKIWKFRNTVDMRLKFPLTAKPHEHLQMFVDNMNRRDSGWTVGECIDGVEHLISYDHDYCWDALGKMASEFNTEFEIVGKRVSLKRVEYNKNNPLALSYGKGNGFRSGVGRNSSDTMPVEFLFVQGGSENIDRSKYGSSVLLLPKNQSIRYDGQYFEDESGFNATNARTYAVDDLGMSIRRADKSPATYAEDSLDCSDIYPKRVGTISSVVTVDAENNLYDIVDSSIPSTLNFADCQIEGEKMTVIFQSGMLAGHGEFEVNYFHNAVNGKAARRFEIVPKEEDGYTMPNETFKPVAGNTYAVFKCMLPDAYIRDNDTKSGAEWDMFRAAVRYMFDHEEEIFTFKGELDSLWAKQDWANIGGRIVLGGYIQFSDTRFQPTGVLVRIVGIKDYVNNPHKPEIELSNQTQSVGFGSEIKKLESQEVENEEYHRDAISFTKRRFRDAKETMDMLSALIEAGFDNFSGSINPITIQTMQMLVGDESLQYRFVNNITNPTTVNHTFTYNSGTKVFSTEAGFIQHMTLGISNLSSSHNVSEYKFWYLAAYTSAALTDGTKKYYVYIKGSRVAKAIGSDAYVASLVLSETPIAMTSVSGWFHFLVGVLNSEYEGERSFVSLYGFTEVLPGRVTTDRVVSGDGNSYFDMLANAMKLGNALDFNSQGDGKLRIKGTIVQSQGGEAETPIGVFRGVWNASYVYYVGDEVVYTANRITSYYRCIKQTTAGIVPTNTTYWQVLSAGERGHFKARAFKRTNEDISETRPSGGSYDSPVPSGWSDGIPDGTAMLWSTVCTFYSDGTNSGWSYPARETDTDLLDIEFSPSATAPSAPTGDVPFADHESEGWYDPSSPNFPTAGTMIWRAERKVSNGVYDGEWVITRIYGEKGNTGQSSFKSTVFCRTNTTPAAPTASQGSYAQPNPPSFTSWPVKDTSGNTISGVYWSDGIPAGEQKLWACTRIFSSDGLIPQQASWTAPRQMTDTDSFDVEFAKMQTGDATPAVPTTANRHGGSGTQVWFDPELDSSEDFTAMYWRAEREKKNGVWGDWVIVRIKGEAGDAGRSVSSFKEFYALTDKQSGVTYNNVTWVEGRMPTGSEVEGTYLWNYEEITYSFGNPTKTPPALIGHNAADGRSITGVTEHYLVSPYNTGITRESSGWTTDPTKAVLSSTNKYLWNYETITYSEGDPTNTTPAVIGAYGDVGGYKSVVFCRCNNTPNTPSNTQSGSYNTYDNPRPPAGTDSAGGTVYWYDAIPAGTAKVWASSCIFYSDGTKSNWSTPRQMTDTDTYDVEFSPNETCPADPSNTDSARTAQGWYDPVRNPSFDFTTARWRAERECKNGSWGSWVKVRIKGENGDDAEFYLMKVSTSTVKRDGNTMAPANITFSVRHIKGNTEEDITSLPTGWYMKLTRTGLGGTITSDKITTIPYTIIAGNLFGWDGNYNNARMDLYDSSDKLISSADTSLCMDGGEGDYVALYYKWAAEKPSKPTGTSATPDGWNTVPDREDPAITYQGDFVLRNGYRYSPVIDMEQAVWQKVSFTTTKANQVIAVDLHVSSELNFDFARIGKLDNSAIIDLHPVTDQEELNNLTLDKISGSTSKVVYVQVPTAGAHFFYVGYTKDTSQDSGTDNCWFRVLTTENLSCWVCQAVIDGTTGLVSEWSDVIQFVYDNASEESVYILSETNTTPATPTSEPLVDDYVPTVTTDWYSADKAYVVGNKVMYSPYTGVQNAFQCIVACTGVVPTNTTYWKQIPTWTDDPLSVGTVYRYQFVAIRRKENGRWGSFSTPRIFTSYIKGDQGAKGDYFEYRYAVNGSTTTAPALSTTVRNPSGWSTVVPSVGSLQYLWMTIAKISGANETLLQNWSTPVRVTPADGQKGDSPALVYRGTYSSSETYYGTSVRVDAVKYGDEWYVARTDAGSFSGVAPTDTSKWNSFGSSFESIATGLLLAENANIAGWIFRNGRLESQKQSNGEPLAYLNGLTGEMRLKGTIQLSTAYSGNISDSNIVYMPSIGAGETKYMSMGQEKDDIGKVVRLFNSSNFGGGRYYVEANTFEVEDNGDGSWSMSGTDYMSIVDPQEIIEMTCFERAGSVTGRKKGQWVLTGRFGVDSFKQIGAKGRFARVLAMGKLGGNASTVAISGVMYDGRTLANAGFTITRTGEGRYTISFPSGTLTSGYYVFFSGHGDLWKGSYLDETNTGFKVIISDDSSPNDGEVVFMILDSSWWFSMT